MEYKALILDYITGNFIEILATITSLVYLVLSIRGKKLLWLFGIISSLLYIYVFFNAKIYADTGINIYYVIMSIYGWIHWSSDNNNNDLPYSRLKLRLSLLLILITGVLFVGITFVLNYYTDSDIAVYDAVLTAASVTATWMLARKILEHWLIWIVVDAVSIGLYLYKGLYATVFLFIFYTILAVLGYFEWKKLWRIQENM